MNTLYNAIQTSQKLGYEIRRNRVNKYIKPHQNPFKTGYQVPQAILNKAAVTPIVGIAPSDDRSILFGFGGLRPPRSKKVLGFQALGS